MNMSRACSDIQKQYINKVKHEASSKPGLICVIPSPEISGGSPKLESYYAKPVVVVDPLEQFRAYDFTHNGEECDGELKSDGWEDSYRYVHGTSTGLREHSALFVIELYDVL